MRVPIETLANMCGVCQGSIPLDNGERYRIEFRCSVGHYLSLDVLKSEAEKYIEGQPYRLTVCLRSTRYLDLSASVRRVERISFEEFDRLFFEPVLCQFLGKVDRLGFNNDRGEFVSLIHVISGSIHLKTVVSSELYQQIPDQRCIIQAEISADTGKASFGDRETKVEKWNLKILAFLPFDAPSRSEQSSQVPKRVRSAE